MVVSENVAAAIWGALFGGLVGSLSLVPLSQIRNTRSAVLLAPLVGAAAGAAVGASVTGGTLGPGFIEGLSGGRRRQLIDELDGL